MSRGSFGRRSLILGGGSALVAAMAPAARATPAAFGGVAVDLSRIVALGGGATAAAFAPALRDEMQGVFADLLANRGGPTLVARISSIFLASYAGYDTGFMGGNDTIEGDGVVVSGGRTLSSTHLLTELPPSYSGAYYLPDIDHRRLLSLAHQFAWWLRREMGV